MKVTDFLPKDISSISIIGLSKNAGKTTVFNQLMYEYYNDRRKIGIVSTGVDGEKYDVWSGKPKPAIYAQPGMLVVTTRGAIEQSEGSFEILEKLKPSAINLDVYVVRTIKGGRVMLTGTPSLHDIRDALKAFQYYGADLSLVDGAYDRLASANPEVTSGTVLAVGAAYHRSLPVILQHLEQWLFRFTLPLNRLINPQIERSLKKGVALWVDKTTEQIHPLDLPFLERWSNKVPQDEGYLFLPGACTGAMLREASSLPHPPVIVLQDSTRLFAKWQEIVDFYRRGGTLQVINANRLLGIAVNPYSPDGYQFDGDGMLSEVAQRAKGIPVFDVIRGKSMIEKG